MSSNSNDPQFIFTPCDVIAGDRCVYSTGVAGTCLKVFQCRQAISDLKKQKPLVLCNSENVRVFEVVCCPEEEERVLSTTEPETRNLSLAQQSV